MKERPILFSGAMVRALLDGTKTQTRRIVKPCKDRNIGCALAPCEIAWEVNAGVYLNCPYGQPGDRLWVREAWGIAGEMPHDPGYIEYRADCQGNFNDVGDLIPRWRPSIHMPRSASRVTLEVTGVRAEHLNDCSDADALAEGVDRTNTSIPGYARERYRRLWESINGGGSWDANPWVWVVDLRRLTP